MMRKAPPLPVHENATFTCTNHKNPLTKGKENGATGEKKPLYLGKARERLAGTGRWTWEKSRQSNRDLRLPETGSACNHQFWCSRKTEGPGSITHQKTECFRSKDWLFSLNRASIGLTNLDFQEYHWPSHGRFQHRSIPIPKQPAITKNSVVIAGLQFPFPDKGIFLSLLFNSITYES